MNLRNAFIGGHGQYDMGGGGGGSGDVSTDSVGVRYTSDQDAWLN